MKHKLILLAAALCASPAFAATFTTTIDAATYQGSTGTITFNDWGYVAPPAAAPTTSRSARVSTPAASARSST